MMYTAGRIEATVRLEMVDPAIAEIVIDAPGSEVNVINEALIREMDACLAEVERTAPVRVVIVRSAKAGQFVTGADLEELRRASRPSDLVESARAFQRLLARVAALSATTVAALEGSALGGGLELALACDKRVVGDDRRIQLGFPEVSLGLLPAGGGTQRLPRLIGLPAGLDLILSSKRLAPGGALKVGLVDELRTQSAVLPAARRLARGPKPKRPAKASGRRSWSLSALQSSVLQSTGIGQALVFSQARARVLQETGGHYPAPLRAIDTVRIGWQRGMEAGLAAEAEAFGELGSGSVSANLVRLFFLTQSARKEPPAESARAVRKVGVLGAGLMGSGIAETAAIAGFDVRLRDVDETSLGRGLASINALLDGAFRTGRWSRSEMEVIRARVAGTTTYEGFASAGLVVEAVFEDLDLKRLVLAEVEERIRPEAVVASNTSAIPLAMIGREAKHPERLVGMHFFSPVHKMALVEVIRPKAAEAWAVDTVVATARRMGKTPIVVNDSPGFYTSRVVGKMMNEAALLFEEGASPREIDRAMVQFGFPVGPITLFDEVGLDVAAHAGAFLADQLAAPSRANAVARLAQAGRKGKKGGLGFYSYATGKREDDAALNELFPERQPKSYSSDEICDRISLAFVLEALHCLAEGVIRSPRDGDLGAILGLGFPPFLGGPFRYVQTMTMDALRGKLETLASRHGPRFTLPEALLPAAFYQE